MTINDLFNTLDFSSYDKIVVHWPMADKDKDDYHTVSFEYSEPLQELFGHISIMTMNETHKVDGSDASLFIHIDPHDGTVIHIYLTREDVLNANTK